MFVCPTAFRSEQWPFAKCQQPLLAMANHKSQEKKRNNYGTLTQIERSQTIEATDERLSLCRPATDPIGTVDKLGSTTPRHSLGSSWEEAINSEELMW